VDIWLSALVWLCLLLCATGLMLLHVRTWRRVRQQELPPDDLDYHRRQYRRRMQASAMLGLMAVAIFVGQLVVPRIESRLLASAYWGAVLLMVGWVGLLAAADVLATKHHFTRLRQTYLIEQAKLHAEIRRMQATRGNGKAPKRNRGPAGRG
jgi:amino acid permease